MRRPALYSCTLLAALAWSAYYVTSRAENTRRGFERSLRGPLRPRVTLHHLAVLRHPVEAFRASKARPNRWGGVL